MTNPDNRIDAHRAASQAAYAIVRSCVDDLLNRIKLGEVTDEEELSDALHSTVDDSLIYTADQWVLAWGLPDADDAEDYGVTAFEELLTARAYCNLRAAVEEHSEEFETAMAVANDAREEKEGA